MVSIGRSVKIEHISVRTSGALFKRIYKKFWLLSKVVVFISNSGKNSPINLINFNSFFHIKGLIITSLPFCNLILFSSPIKALISSK